jgi:mono/diheme cytochrome c family protein
MMRLCSVLFFLVFVAVFAVQANNSSKRQAPQLYRKYCVSCHGSDGRAKTSKGKFSHARDFTDAKWHDEVTDERIFNSIMNGRSVRGNMPSFSNKINQQEAESLVNFVRRFKGQSEVSTLR